jgi:PKD repeat protein
MNPIRTLASLVLLFIVVLVPACYKKGQPIPVTINVTDSILGNPFTVPAKLAFYNNTSGADSFRWTFPGGDPASSTQRDPGTITYVQAGDYTVTFEAWNLDEHKTKELTFHLDSSVHVAFDTTILVNHFAPVQVNLTNQTLGASGYSWTFQGGMPATSTAASPPTVRFDSAGTHTITLVVSNGGQTYTLSKTVTVLPVLSASFNVVPVFNDDDYQAPMDAVIHNTTISGLHAQWSCPGATISGAGVDSAAIRFLSPGSYTVTLTTGNDKATQTVTRTVQVFSNTNLRTMTGIRLGVNTAQNTIGSYYSTRLRRVVTASSRLDTAGKWIDIAFYGLNTSFVYNKFITPDSAASYALTPVPGVSPTVFIDNQELCGCSAVMSASDFDAMTNDGPLRALTITATDGGWRQFDNSEVPRVVLFQTHDGRKGAISIKQFVANGAASYIVADIKVQKSPL